MAAVMTREELAGAALAAAPFAGAVRLAEWVGTGRELTGSGVLRPAVAVQACHALGIPLPAGKPRSAKDVAELAQAWDAAVAAGLVLVTANRASAAPDVPDIVRASDDASVLGPELADRVALAWLRAAGMPLGFPGDPCGECLTVLHALRQAAGPVEVTELVTAAVAAGGAGPAPGLLDDLGSYVCPDCGQLHTPSMSGPSGLPGLPGILPGVGDALGQRELDLAEHAAATVSDLVDFGAAATGPGKAPGGTVTLTRLGALLADSIMHTLSPDPGLPAADLVESVAWLPPKVALAATAAWLAARAPDAAVRELLDFAAAFDGPMLRFVALEIARSLGGDGAPAWREAARRPGFGAYARQWLAFQGEPAETDDRDEPWLLADTMAQAIGQLPDGLGALVLVASLRAVPGGIDAEQVAGIRDCGHPRAAEMARLLSGMPGMFGQQGGRDPVVTLLPYGSRGTTGYLDQDEYDEDEVGPLLQLKVTLRGVAKPPVWRRVLVPATMTLGELHGVIVGAMGWDGSHLHSFSDGLTEYGTPDGEFGPDDAQDEAQDEDEVELDEVLAEPGDRLSYTYDFGDDWEHDIKLEKILPVPPVGVDAIPACLAGKGACPPEDCGGAWAYTDLKEAIADPGHEGHDEMLRWLGLDDPSDFDPAGFDIGHANARLHGAPLGEGALG